MLTQRCLDVHPGLQIAICLVALSGLLESMLPGVAQILLKYLLQCIIKAMPRGRALTLAGMHIYASNHGGMPYTLSPSRLMFICVVSDCLAWC